MHKLRDAWGASPMYPAVLVTNAAAGLRFLGFEQRRKCAKNNGTPGDIDDDAFARPPVFDHVG